MHMLCKVSTLFSDVDCPTCGQGFVVYWTRQRAGEREQQREMLQKLLCQQHTSTGSADAHAPAFQMPDAPVTLARHPHHTLSAAVPLYS